MQLFCSRRVLEQWVIKRDDSRALITRVEDQLSSSIRILITDDFESWRRQVRLLFQARPEWQVIAEALDGAEAVQKAEELKPDLIVLDIGLPKLDGIAAALRIRQLSPGSKIVFLSQNNDLDFVRAALGTGALGYVHKADAHRELLPAMDAVFQGKQFVSSSLKGYKFSDTSGEEAPHHHEVLFYSDDTIFLERFTRFIVAALKAGSPAFVIATKSHRDSLLQKLRMEDVDVDTAIQRGTYIPLDAADTLSSLMVNGLPDSARFFERISALIEAASKVAKARHHRVAICGEGVGLLWAGGMTDAAVRIEQLCNDLGKSHDVDMLCAYPLGSFRDAEDEQQFRSLCKEHSAVHSQ